MLQYMYLRTLVFLPSFLHIMFINLQSSPLFLEYHVCETWALFYYFCENIFILNSGFLFLFTGYHVS